MPDTAALRLQDSLYRAEQAKYYAHIVVKSHYDGHAVRLRWAPDAAGGWLNANRLGYTLERVDMGPIGDTSFHETPSFKALAAGKLLPLDQQGWKDLHEQLPEDLYVMVAGEMIHTAQLPENMGFRADILAASNELKERFSFALLAADLSWPAAVGSALGFTDSTVVPGHQYLYRVAFAGDSSTYPIESGVALVRTGKAEPIKRPVITQVTEKNNLVLISWPREPHEAVFTAYDVERSEDAGQSWEQVNNRPFVSFTNPELPATRDVIVYTDTIQSAGKRYAYRIIGYTAFGRRSEPSTAVMAQWRDRQPPPSPTGVHVEEKSKGTITITWNYPPNVADLKGFHISRGTSMNADETVLNKELLPPSTRSFTDSHPEQHNLNYYLVIAVDTANNPGISLSAMGTVVDTLPPAVPTGLQGEVDTNGVVTLTWNLGKETDILGYHVFWKNQRDHVASRLTGTALRDTVFTDTISMHTLTEHVYYSVMAMDLNKNGSAHTVPIELKRPDLIPPTAPVFKDYRVSKEGIHLQWAPSSSEDVVRHVVLRRTPGEAKWDTLASIPVADKVFTFTDPDMGKPASFEYAVVAFDDAGWSTFGPANLKLHMYSKEHLPKVEVLEAEYDAERKRVALSWDYAPREGVKFVLYKNVSGGPWQQVKLLGGTERAYDDRLVEAGQEYGYFIQVVSGSVQDSDYSPEVNVKVKL